MKQESQIRKCPGDSVGGILYKGDKILMLWRLSYPQGWAPPAGHVDKHGSSEQALKNEFKEEVGIEVLDAKLIFNGVINNPCKRGFNQHEWFVCEIPEGSWQGEPRVMEPEKAREVRWFTEEEITEISTQDLDPAWHDIFKKLGLRKS